MDWLVKFFTATMEVPKPYGWFHIMFIFIMLATTVLICVFFRKSSDKTFRRIIFILWLIALCFEIYKQIVYTFDAEPKGVYKMYVFPFQFCSLALFVYPFIIWGKDSKFRDSLIILSATFIFFGGFGTYLVPTSFQNYVGVNIQTMVHHGIQIVVGIFLVCHEHKKFTYKNFLYSMIPYVCVLAIALGLNELQPLMPKDNNDFNIFYISRHVENQLPVLATFWHQSYPLFLCIYIFGFAGVAFVLFLIEKYLYDFVAYLYHKHHKKDNGDDNNKPAVKVANNVEVKSQNKNN